MSKLIKMTTTEVRKNLSDAVSRVEYGKEPIGIVRRGRVRAVMIPVTAYALYVHLMEGGQPPAEGAGSTTAITKEKA